MTKDNIDTRLEAIENKLDSLAGSSYPMMGGAFSSSRDDEIDLGELWNIVWQGKWIVGVITFVFAIVSVIYALSLPNIYKSEVLLAPAEESSGGGLASMAGQLGGLASLAGVNLGGGGSDKIVLAIEILKSREFISRFVQKHDLLVPLMAAKGWDRAQNELIIDEDIYDADSKRWVGTAKPPRTSEPTMQEAYKEFLEKLNVSQDKKTSFIYLSVEHYSPKLAKAWVDFLVSEINEEIRTRDVEEAQNSIKYLSAQLEKTAIAEMQRVFYKLIEEQTATIMFANVRDEYVFKTIDQAVEPELKAKPKRAFICVLGFLLGGIISVVFVLIRHFSK